MGRGTKRSGGEQRGRFSGNQQGQQKKRKYYSEGARAGEIRGKGIWFTCERRKEAKAVFEAYDLLNEVSGGEGERRDVVSSHVCSAPSASLRCRLSWRGRGKGKADFH